MSGSKKMTPLMQQFWSIKQQHRDKILFFRMGDFFEMFGEDAEVAAPILNIALTYRNKKSGDDTKMCGMPHHSIATPIAKLLAAGYKVAICDQVEDPKEAKGIVKREVTRILSPGMVYDPETLDQLQANYLCAFDENSLSFLETTTGEAFYYRVRGEASRERLMALLSPTELVLTTDQKQNWLQRQDTLSDLHLSLYEGSIDGLAKDLPESARRLLSYAQMMQGESLLRTLSPFEERRLQSRMELSPTVVRHLELFETYKGEKKGSLFFAINRTKTSAGARRLKDWIRFPLTDVQEIEQRLERVDAWYQHPDRLKALRQILSGMGDIERRLGKVSNPGCNARDLLALSQSLRAGLEIQNYAMTDTLSVDLCATAAQLVEKIEKTVVDEPGLSIKDGGIIRSGICDTLDELIQLSKNSQRLLTDLEAKERDQTGIPSLKIRFNNVFGYYIEVTKTHTAKVPKHYVRKQTLTNAERYITDELQKLEDKVLSAKAKRAELEFEKFQELRESILALSPELIVLARQWSEIDVSSSLAWLAMEYNYTRPCFSKANALTLRASRHPVVEQEVSQPFVPNTVELKRSECLLLTGPNMAGKSTLMRQVAILSILAQMGSFVPAETAVLPVFDRIFTRIGASDHLSEGLSTFMVEMKETAEMLRSATQNSLVVLDEVGRGTSTYDGMTLAQAILEFLVTQRKCITLFATHYHELTRLSASYPQIQNAHMSIQEKQGEITFLHTLKTGPANKSYGIQVARLAGLPTSVTQRAKRLLDKLESFQGGGNRQMSLLEMENMDAPSPEDSEFASEKAISEEIESLLKGIKDVSLQQTTPLEALNLIAKWQQDLS